MNRFLTLIIVLLMQHNISSQSLSDSLLLTTEQSTEWLNKLEKLPVHSQIELIKKRILLDTNVYARSASCRIILKTNASDSVVNTEDPNEKTDKKKPERIYSNRILIILNGLPIHDVGEMDTQTAMIHIAEIDKLNIKKTAILKGATTTALYGSRAVMGVIILTE